MLAFDSEYAGERATATIEGVSGREQYECLISVCENPVCTCKTVYLDCTPITTERLTEARLPSRRVEIDIAKRTPRCRHKTRIAEEDLKFSELFFSRLDEEDFRLLYDTHFALKNRITEQAAPDSIDAFFEYDAVESSGLMSAYNDVLPYGDQLLVTISGKQCVIFDQYCLLPGCSCTDTVLSVFPVGDRAKERSGEEKSTELCIISLNYRKKRWEKGENGFFPLTVESVRRAAEQQIPDIYERLLKRHLRLKAIYAHCRRKHYSPKQAVQLVRVGRNDPCPCGSGKKYKKCCLEAGRA